MPRPASPQADKAARKFLGCGCSTWLWSIAGVFLLLALIGLLSDPDAPAAEQSAAVPTFTDTPAPLPTATDTPVPPPTNTPVPTDTPPPPVVEQRAAPVVPIVPAAPAAPAAALSDCLCDRDIYNCKCDADNPDCQTFATSFDAQSCYMRCMDLAGRDIHGLDGDGDGSACEWKWE